MSLGLVDVDRFGGEAVPAELPFRRHGVEAEDLPHASRRPMYQSGAAVHNERRRGAVNSLVDRHTRRRWNELNIGAENPGGRRSCPLPHGHRSDGPP